MDKTSRKSVGAFNWHATHGTSMSRDNKLISGDNKGAAARFFEDWFVGSNANASTTIDRRPNSLCKLMIHHYVYRQVMLSFLLVFAF